MGLEDDECAKCRLLETLGIHWIWLLNGFLRSRHGGDAILAAQSEGSEGSHDQGWRGSTNGQKPCVNGGMLMAGTFRWWHIYYTYV